MPRMFIASNYDGLDVMMLSSTSLHRRPQTAQVSAIRAALETAGVEFIAENGGGPGVRLMLKPAASHRAEFPGRLEKKSTKSTDPAQAGERDRGGARRFSRRAAKGNWRSRGL